jgi:hypothetical protein
MSAELTPGAVPTGVRAAIARFGSGPTVRVMDTPMEYTGAPGIDDMTSAPAWLSTTVPTARCVGFHSTLSAPPRAQRRSCYLAVDAARVALRTNPRAPYQGVEDAVRLVGRERLHRTQFNQVASFTYALVRCMPKGARLAGGEVELAAATAAPGTRAQLASTAVGLFVRDGAGAAWAYRVHPAFRTDAVADEWIARLTGLDGQLGAMMPAFAGSVVVTPRNSVYGIHRDTTSTHPLGQCPTCPVVAPRTPGRWGR